MTSPPSRPSFRLSLRDQTIIRTVTRFRQVSASQLKRLCFSDGSPVSQGHRQRRALLRLVNWGEVKRLPRVVGGFQGGSGGFVYVPVTSRARIPDPHTLDITELYVRLKEQGEVIAFDPEPYSYVEIGHLELKPDAFLDIRNAQGRFRYWIEVDLGTEYRSQLSGKLRRYVLAYQKWRDPTFPLILLIVPDRDRLRFVEGVVKRQEMPGLFDVVLFDDAVRYLIGE